VTSTLTREELTAALDAATRDLPAHEKVAVAERVAREVARHQRRLRYATPGALAHKIDPLTTVETPALALIDTELVQATERMEAGESVRLGIFAPPQEGKSRRVTIAWPLWLLLRNPNLRIAIVSFELDVAAGFSAPIRNFIVEHGSGTPTRPRPLSEDLLGITLRGDSTSRARFNIAGHQGSVTAVGMKGGLTTKAVDVLIIDDPYKNREVADNPKLRAVIEDWYRNVALPRLPSAACVVLVQTRWHPADLAGYVIAAEQALPEHLRRWRFISIPAQAQRPRPTPTPDAAGCPTPCTASPARTSSRPAAAPPRTGQHGAPRSARWCGAPCTSSTPPRRSAPCSTTRTSPATGARTAGPRRPPAGLSRWTPPPEAPTRPGSSPGTAAPTAAPTSPTTAPA
jgi:hypothetical protein